MKKILSIIALSIAVMACGGKTNLETALIQAGDNRAELEKVLNHYAVDSLKYKAACFLIENMHYHYSIRAKRWIMKNNFSRCFMKRPCRPK
mgnify:CR=1 FL=1